jgi:hypothetical protein
MRPSWATVSLYFRERSGLWIPATPGVALFGATRPMPGHLYFNYLREHAPADLGRQLDAASTAAGTGARDAANLLASKRYHPTANNCSPDGTHLQVRSTAVDDAFLPRAARIKVRAAGRAA